MTKAADTPLFGLLNVDKPTGITSRDAVNHVQRLTRPAKVGHAGRLDPLATGVLVVCLGPATRLVEYLHELPKSYRATFRFGQSSDTDDRDGQLQEHPGQRQPTAAELAALLPQFTGTIQQRPPAFSAIKTGGRRAYALARRGVATELPPRPVRIHRLELVSYEYPEWVLDVDCGSGTYMRSLGRDLAAALDATAVMHELRRTAIGPFAVGDAVPLAAIRADNLRQLLLPPERGITHLTRLELDDASVRRLLQGQRIGHAVDAAAGETLAAFDAQGRLAGIVAHQPPGCLRPLRMFVRTAED